MEYGECILLVLVKESVVLLVGLFLGGIGSGLTGGGTKFVVLVASRYHRLTLLV